MPYYRVRSTIRCCFGCKDRHYKCHSDCKEYKRQKEEYEKLKEKVRKESVPISIINESKERVMKLRKAKRK